jgi:hypothetical protein
MSWATSVSRARTPIMLSLETQKSGKRSSRFIASFMPAIASSRPISAPSR